jgi:hypothetical protein
MPCPITAQLINSTWDAIKDAVTTGLDMPVPYGLPQPALDTVLIVSTEKLSQAKDWRHVQIPNAPPHVRVEESGDVIDVMHHYDLSYHDLGSPDTEAIKTWARQARQFELTLALQRYAQAATKRDDPQQLDPDGWGQRQWVVFNSAGRGTIPDNWERADLERTVRIDHRPVDGLQGLVFRIGGGPYVRRPADLTLGWAPAANYKAELLLTEQLEFMNVKANTVMGIKTTPALPAAAKVAQAPDPAD